MSRSTKIPELRKKLRTLMLKGLRESCFSLDDLQQFGVRVRNHIVPTSNNVAVTAGIAEISEKIVADSDIHAASKIFKEVVSQVCRAYEQEQSAVEVATNDTLSPTGLPMLGAIVTRCQYAVGHGGFHVGRIKFVNDSGLRLAEFFAGDEQGTTILDLEYVYDCGSEDTDAFARSIQDFRRDCAKKLEILFVSHLHADHINRIDTLLGYKEPRIVVLPYLDLEDVAAMAILDFRDGHFSGLYRDYIRDPVSWWRNRGVEIIIFIEPGDDGSVPPDSPPPDRPSGGKPTKYQKIEPAGQLAHVLQKPLGEIPEGLAAANPNFQPLPGSSVLAGPGSLFRLEWRLGRKEGWRPADWILLPYVHPVKETQRAAFRTALLNHLKLVAPAPDEFQKRLLEELVLSDNAKKMIDIYSDHFARNHNAVSLSLYSGPAAKQSMERDRSWHIWDSSSSRGASWKRWDENAPCGWLSTGDSMLKEAIRRRPWRKFYSRYEGKVGILTLPHHGSFHNFHDDLLDWNGLRLAVATTVKREKRIAGLGETLARVAKKRKHAHVVDDKASQTLDTEARRLLVP
jgi:hypothetical protein